LAVIARGHSTERAVQFTELEDRVRKELLKGLSEVDIAGVLGMSERTINRACARIRQKMGVENQNELLLALGRDADSV
jgi:DNA-binding CsgD family transcriptional regulator